ncbi:hypothetical protein M23134_01510 [Microscilla marina ATCC 23134]|uniref:Uncharacterized protein n=2 Tax=Microscilla marina TaxID=1027 RepID=A1ZJZ7_MICM2|nr:hypothetical protein M23134_01510 [Microscilla marina ATCC 23134]
MKEKFLDMLQNDFLEGFIGLVKGEILHRYIIMCTANYPLLYEYLEPEFGFGHFYKKIPFENIAMGGLKDFQTGYIYFWFGTSTKSLAKATEVATKYKQIAIRDNVEKKEIRLK